MEKISKKYYIGLDIGTNSVGYAVTDEKYNLIRMKGKKAWGVRLFSEASSAEERRMKRTNRRRIDRRKLKLSWLEEIFKPQIDKIDDKFLQRKRYSSLFEEDKAQVAGIHGKDSLFNCEIDGKRYTDKDFYNEYKTIYHLRKDLTERPAKDVRFLYLAIHNIIKRRGHFLFEGELGENIPLAQLFNKKIDYFQNECTEILGTISLNKLEESREEQLFQQFFQARGVRERKACLYQIFDAKDKVSKKLLDVLVDGKIRPKDLFIDNDSSETFSLQDEEGYAGLCEVLSDEEIMIVDALQQIYSVLNLKKIIGKNEYICQSMVEIFEKHSKQLKFFKKYIKKFYPSKYYDVFRNPLSDSNKQFTNYPLYIDLTSFGGSKKVIGPTNAKRTEDEFYKYIKSILSQPCENMVDEKAFIEGKEKILSLIDNRDFLPRLRSKNNSVFPNKLYKKELKKILEVNKAKFPFLLEKDESGLSNIEKIIEILKFRVPYFVGPIGQSENDEQRHGWVNRENNLKLYPWTLSKIVDFDKAEDAFIQRMTNKCSYLKDQDVLPKYSLLYSKFRVLNELNNLRINGNKISVELKQKIFKDLFKKNKNVSAFKLKEFLVKEGLVSKEEIADVQLTGFDKNFANNLSSYISLSQILGEKFVEENEQTAEEIIKLATLISDKSRFAKRLEKLPSGKLNSEQIKKLKGLSFNGWGSLSYKFLQGLRFVNYKTGELTSIIDEMWQTNQNLQEILFNKEYSLGEELEKLSKREIATITYQNVEELYCSPAVKRAVWQAIKIVNEIISIAKEKPAKIFVEVSRHDEKKGEDGRKLSRKDNLLKIYQSKEFKEKVKEMAFDIEKLENELDKKQNTDLRSEKLYLYFMQLGKCAYTGEPIDINDLNNDNLYDIDHIFPQSLVKDDSIENKVLVKKIYNEYKSDTYPFFNQFDWARKQERFWQQLVRLHLMSDKKYSRLVKTEFSDDELGTFIAKQLVETNQSTKCVIDLLRNMMENPRDVVFSKAKFVTQFRNQFDIYKCREVNDLHHAKDAYLNIVVGNVLFNRFTDDPRHFYLKANKNNSKTKNIEKLFTEQVKNYNSDQIVWDGKEDIKKVKQTCEKNDAVVSFLSFSKRNGAFYDDSIYKSLKNDPKSVAKISLKGNLNNPLCDVAKYGGYNKLSTAYFTLIESEGANGKKIKTIEAVPKLIVWKYRNCDKRNEKILEFIAKENNLKNAKVLIEKINIMSTLKIGKGEYLLAGKSGDKYAMHNANQWRASEKEVLYSKAIVKLKDMLSKKPDEIEEVDNKIVVSPKRKEDNREIVITKQENEQLYQTFIDLLDKPTYKDLTFVAVRKCLVDGHGKFKALSVKEQAMVLYNLLSRIKSGTQAADLRLIGGSANTGKISLGKNITGKEIWLIERSVTGLQQKMIKM